MAKTLKYIITGTGRCGTVWLAKLFSSINIPCSHEAVFTNKGLDFALEVLNENVKPINSSVSKAHVPLARLATSEASYMAAPFLNHECLKNTNIIHIARNPIKVIFSFVKSFRYFNSPQPKNNYEKFIHQYTPEVFEELTPVSRAARYYILWNRMIEKLSHNKYMFHRVEDNVDGIFQFLKVNPPKYDDDRKANARKEYHYTWDDIPIHIRNELKEIAECYGYKN